MNRPWGMLSHRRMPATDREIRKSEVASLSSFGRNLKFRGAWIFMAIVLLVAVAACDPSRVFDEYRAIPDATWEADSVMTFQFNIARTSQNNNIWFNIRNDQKYEYSNLWLFVTIEPPSGAAVTDTVQIILADPSGKWLGKGFSGLYDNRLIYRRNVYFPESGRYTLRIRHGMRPETLRGITDVGVRIEKLN